MKNIHGLPTDKPSRLFITDGKLFNYHKPQEGDGVKIINQNIYITSDEKLPYDSTIFHTGAFYHRDFGGDIHIINKDTHYPNPNFCKRIILTTDQDLIDDGVQAIDDEFLEWFINNPSCDRVEVERDSREVGGHNGGSVIEYGIYEIIIPKEEAKQELPQLGTKEFNDLASAYFGGKPKQYLEKEMFELEQELDILSHLRWHNSKPKQETLEEFIERTINESFEIDLASSKIEKYMNIAANWQQEKLEETMHENWREGVRFGSKF